MTSPSQAGKAPKDLPYSNKGDLTKGTVSSHLIRLTVPMIWGIFAIISFQLVDTFYISMLGTEPLAALSFTFPLTYMIFSFIMGFGIAMSSVLSRLIGSGDRETVRRVATHGIMLVFGIGIIVAMLGMRFHDSIFRAMGAGDEMVPMIADYMMIWFAGAMFMTVPVVGNAGIRATGDSLSPAIIMSVVAGVNLVLDPILIFGLLGAPRMELQGAALSTVIANICAMAAGIYIMARRKKLITPLSEIRLDLFWDSVKRLLHIALPAGLMNSLQPAVNAFILSLLAVYGPEAVAAFGVVTRLEAFAFIILMAVSVGMAPVIGQNWGAAIYDRVHQTLRLAIGFNVIWSVFVALIFGLMAYPLAGVFSDDPAVIKYAVLYMLLVPFSYAFANLLRGWASAFNAMGMPERSFAMVVIEMLLLMIPATYIGHMLAGVPGIFMAMAFVNVAAGLGSHLYSRYVCNQKEDERRQSTT